MKHPISVALDDLEAAHEEGWLLTGKEENMDRDQLRSLVMDLKAKVTALRKENERLRAKALIWHKWPGGKPTRDGKYITLDKFGDPQVMFFQISNPWVNPIFITHWAEIPRPNDRNPAIPPDR